MMTLLKSCFNNNFNDMKKCYKIVLSKIQLAYCSSDIQNDLNSFN